MPGPWDHDLERPGNLRRHVVGSAEEGLVVRPDRDLRPVASFPSRANGRRHGVTSVIEAGGRLLVAAKGGDAILDLGPVGGEPRLDAR